MKLRNSLERVENMKKKNSKWVRAGKKAKKTREKRTGTKKVHITLNAEAVEPFIKKWKSDANNKMCCVVCGEKMELVLQEHHIDGNHRNNKPKNLAWLCANCHNILNKATNINDAKNALRKRHQKFINLKGGAKAAWEKIKSSAEARPRKGI